MLYILDLSYNAQGHALVLPLGSQRISYGPDMPMLRALYLLTSLSNSAGNQR